MLCRSKIGKISGQAGYQHLSLGVSCYNRQVALHELLHTMGFYHEQARSDRDAYIDIDFNNLPPGIDWLIIIIIVGDVKAYSKVFFKFWKHRFWFWLITKTADIIIEPAYRLHVVLAA